MNLLNYFNIITWQRYFGILIITIVGLILRLLFLDLKGIWLDEASSFTFANREIFEIPSYVSVHDNHPPFYYLVLHVFMLGGWNEFVLRFASVIFGALTVPVVYMVGKKLFDSQTGFLSSILLAFSPMHIYYSQEARMYPLFTLLSLISIYFFVSLCEGNKKFPYFIGYIGSTSLCLYTHYFGFLILIFQLLYFLFACLRNKSFSKSTLPFFTSFVIPFLLFYPWLSFMMKQSRIEGLSFNLSLRSLDLLTLKYAVLFNDVSVFWSSKHSFFGLPSDVMLIARGLVLTIFLLLFIYGGYRFLKNNPYQHIILITLSIIIPVLIVSAAFLYGVRIWLSKYFLFIIPSYLFLVAQGIIGIKKKRSILLLILILSVCVYSISNNYSREVEDWRGAVEFVNANWMEGDKIIFDREYVKKPFFYYVMKWNLSFQKDMVESEGQNRRVWLVISHTTPNQSQMKAMLDESYTQMDFKEFLGIQVYLYTASISDQ